MKSYANLENNLEVLKNKVFDNILKIFAFIGLGICFFFFYNNNFIFTLKDSYIYFTVAMGFLLYFLRNKLLFEVKVVLFYFIGLVLISLGMHFRGIFSLAPLFVIFISSFLPLFLPRKKVYLVFLSYLVVYIFNIYSIIQNSLIPEFENKDIIILMGPVRGVTIFAIAFSLIKIVEYYNDLLLMNYATIEHKNAELKEYHDNLEKIVHERTEKLESSLIREKEAGDLKFNFISRASHEFRTPLTSINGLVQLVLNYSDKLTKEQLKERLERVQLEVANMTAILEDVLVISRVGVEKMPFNPVEINLVDFVKEIIVDYQLVHNDTRKVIFNSVDDVVYGKVDSKLMKQIVINLFSNALKFSEFPSPIEVSILKENDKVVFSILDHGIGISKEEQKCICEPFYRANNAENESGTGLGLAIVDMAVKLHKGKLQISSKLGKGSVFKVVFP